MASAAAEGEPTLSEPNEQQIVQAMQARGQIILAAGPAEEAPVGVFPTPNEIWDLTGGMAWVFYGEGNTELTRPVIMADGFNSGPSTIGFSWAGLNQNGYPMISELRRRGRDVIIVGFAERSASIMDNAQVVIEAIFQANAQRRGSAPLAVGGFSMGGLVTRYALTRLETQQVDHQTALYWSYDSPHRGAWIPISLQSFAHYVRQLNPSFSEQINSPASQQLLWRHISEWDAKPEESQERTDFLTALRNMGGWPMRPLKIGVANGVSTGLGNGLKPRDVAFEGTGLGIRPTKLYLQGPDDNELVAELRVVTLPTNPVYTPAMPTLDSAPGGTLDGFGILADVLNEILGMGCTVSFRTHCFVPAVSAVAIADVDSDSSLYTSIDDLPASQSELDEFKCASQNEEHTKITEELCTWIFDRLP